MPMSFYIHIYDYIGYNVIIENILKLYWLLARLDDSNTLLSEWLSRDTWIMIRCHKPVPRVTKIGLETTGLWIRNNCYTGLWFQPL